MPEIEYLKASQVDILGKVLRQKLLNADSSLAKSYLNILVDEIVVENKTATIRGSKAALAETMQQIKKVQNQCPVLTLIGALGGIRTHNLLIRSSDSAYYRVITAIYKSCPIVPLNWAGVGLWCDTK